MRGPFRGELRMRVIHFVEAGGSRREAAEQFQVSASSAIRWMQRFSRRWGLRTNVPWREHFPPGEVFAADPRPDPRTTGPYVE
jgi:transposase